MRAASFIAALPEGRRARAILACAALLPVLVALFGWTRAELVAPKPTLLLLDKDGGFLAEVGTEESGEAGYWAMPEPPERIVAATLAAEDRRLGWHLGVDPIAIARAVKQNAMHQRRVSGASTLAMQVARMQSPGSRTYLRKGEEAIAALAITARFGNAEVLRHYLRIAPYGNRCRGAAYASRRYFDKPIEDLTWAEAAFLAALPQAPGRMNPLVPQGRMAAEARATRILDILRDDATIDDAEHARATAQLAELVLPIPGRRTDEAMHAVLRLEALFAPSQEAYAARPVVKTTLDLELQKEVSWLLDDQIAEWEKAGAGNAAAIIVDAKTMEVRAWVGSTDYFDKAHAGSIDYARVPRSPGSTLKPLFYAHAMDRGVLTPATILDDLRMADGAIANADERFLGPLLPRVALGNSRNVPATEVVDRIGLDEAHDFLRIAGLHDGSVRASHFGRGLAIGNQPTTLEQLVRAYSVFPGDGVLRDLRWTPGEAVPGKRILSEDAARRTTQFLADPLARLPTFPRMGASELPFAAAVKTGTSMGYRDAWTVAWTPKYLVAVWVGHPDWRPMRELGGFRSAAEITKDLLLLLHEDQTDGLADISFPPPRGTHPVRLCARTGLVAGEACEHAVTEWYSDADAPRGTCDAHLRIAVDRRNGLLATGRTPLEHRELRNFADLGPRYAAWAADEGIAAPPAETSPLDAQAPGETWTMIGSAGAVVRAEKPVKLRISTPANGDVILRDPEMPAGMSSVPLEAIVEGPAKQVVWYVDGKPFEVVGHPFTTRWTLTEGEHTFQARVPFREERSAVIRVTVR